jgi:hypothetical protein
MNTPTTSARIFAVYDEYLPPCLFVSHPAMQRRLKIDLADPGKLSYAEAAGFAQGWDLVEGRSIGKEPFTCAEAIAHA